jgi:hypothetical protein
MSICSAEGRTETQPWPTTAPPVTGSHPPPTPRVRDGTGPVLLPREGSTSWAGRIPSIPEATSTPSFLLREETEPGSAGPACPDPWPWRELRLSEIRLSSQPEDSPIWVTPRASASAIISARTAGTPLPRCHRPGSRAGLRLREESSFSWAAWTPRVWLSPTPFSSTIPPPASGRPGEPCSRRWPSTTRASPRTDASSTS